MKIWLDTINLGLIKKAVEMGVIHGVTTNPAILAQTEKSFEVLIEELLDEQMGPVAVQVVANDAKEMIRQGQALSDFSNRIIVKIPAVQAGFEAIHRLSRHQSIPTMATGVFTPEQVLIASLAGANFVAPYFSRIAKTGANPWDALRAMQTILAKGNSKTQLLVASISKPEEVAQIAGLGIDFVTLKEPIFDWLVQDNPWTVAATKELQQNLEPVSALLK